MANLCVKLWRCLPSHHTPKDGTDDYEQAAQWLHHAGALPSKTPPFPKATPEFKDPLTNRNTKTPRAESSGPQGRVLASSKAGAEAGESMESRACLPPRGRIKELLWRCRLCSGSH